MNIKNLIAITILGFSMSLSAQNLPPTPVTSPTTAQPIVPAPTVKLSELDNVRFELAKVKLMDKVKELNDKYAKQKQDELIASPEVKTINDLAIEFTAKYNADLNPQILEFIPKGKK